MSEHIPCVVIGAGVVGLAIAREFARNGIETLVVEKANTIGTETSSRNSEVIHAGIYYPQGSLKAKLCVEGKHLLYEYCKAFSIPHKRIGKMIVATHSEQVNALKALEVRAKRNGVGDLQWLDPGQQSDFAPGLRAEQTLFSPSSGIIDSHQFMLSLQGEIERHGSMLVFNTQFVSAKRKQDKWEIEVQDTSKYTFSCDALINSAGLHAVNVAHAINGLPCEYIPTQYYAKGNYFSCHTPHDFRHLIYPLPSADGLGIHLTLDLAGNIRFGPNVEWVENISYAVNEKCADTFYKAIREYWPSLPDDTLTPDYAGIRPKIQPAGTKDTDFLIQEGKHLGLPGLVNLFGIESPGITASLAIARFVFGLTDCPK